MAWQANEHADVCESFQVRFHEHHVLRATCRQTVFCRPWSTRLHRHTCADEFDAERADLLRRISGCSASASESHTLRCTAQKRAEEVRELQQALSAAHVHLFEERDRLLRLQAENDELRMQAAEDRRHIQHLTSLHNPVSQEVTLQKGGQPSSAASSRNTGGQQSANSACIDACMGSCRKGMCLQPCAWCRHCPSCAFNCDPRDSSAT